MATPLVLWNATTLKWTLGVDYPAGVPGQMPASSAPDFATPPQYTANASVQPNIGASSFVPSDSGAALNLSTDCTLANNLSPTNKGTVRQDFLLQFSVTRPCVVRLSGTTTQQPFTQSCKFELLYPVGKYATQDDHPANPGNGNPFTFSFQRLLDTVSPSGTNAIYTLQCLSWCEIYQNTMTAKFPNTLMANLEFVELASPAWELSGNAGTDPAQPANNFLGTTDAKPLVVKTQGVERMRVTTGGVGIGTGITPNQLTVASSATDDGIKVLGNSGSQFNGVYVMSDVARSTDLTAFGLLGLACKSMAFGIADAQVGDVVLSSDNRLILRSKSRFISAGTLKAPSDFYITGDLFANGNATIAGNEFVTGNLAVNGMLTVAGVPVPKIVSGLVRHDGKAGVFDGTTGTFIFPPPTLFTAARIPGPTDGIYEVTFTPEFKTILSVSAIVVGDLNGNTTGILAGDSVIVDFITTKKARFKTADSSFPGGVGGNAASDRNFAFVVIGE